MTNFVGTIQKMTKRGPPNPGTRHFSKNIILIYTSKTTIIR